MAHRHHKKILVIEWLWLVTGAAIAVTYTIEAWASPYSPILWMLGLTAFFLIYRGTVTAYEMMWPEPEKPQVDEVPQVRRRGGDGITGTVAYALPQMRGRSVPQDREQKRAEAMSKLEIPAADGGYQDPSLDTVFAYVGDDDSSDSPSGGEASRRRKTSASRGLFGLVVYDYDNLRPETDDDLTGTDLPIPSFAESKLTTLEREKVLESGIHGPSTATLDEEEQPGIFGIKTHHSEKSRRDDFRASIDTKGHSDNLRPETGSDLTGTDVSIPDFAESSLTTIEREKALEAIRGAEHRPHKTANVQRHKPLNLPPAVETELAKRTKSEHSTLPEKTRQRSTPDQLRPPAPNLDEMKLDEMKRDEMKRDEMKRDEMKLDEMKRDEMKLDEMKRDEMKLDEKTRQRDVPPALKSIGDSAREKP